MAVIDDPAVAIAVERCLSARAKARRVGDEWTERHPRHCEWCDLPRGYLAELLEGWNEWAQPQDQGKGVVYGRVDAQRFAELQRRDPAAAEALIVAAQGLDPVPDARGEGGSDPRGSLISEDRSAATFSVEQVQNLEPTASKTADEPDPELAAWA